MREHVAVTGLEPGHEIAPFKVKCTQAASSHAPKNCCGHQLVAAREVDHTFAQIEPVTGDDFVETRFNSGEIIVWDRFQLSTAFGNKAGIVKEPFEPLSRAFGLAGVLAVEQEDARRL
jgi:hypothetical protein